MVLKEWQLLQEIADLNVKKHMVGNKISVNSKRIQLTLIFENKQAQTVDDFISSLILTNPKGRRT